MYTLEQKINYIEIATEIAEWMERNFGYFVNKNVNKNKVINDFSKQLKRLPVGAMSFYEQVQNNLIDTGIKRPPSPSAFIQELKICFNTIKTENGHVKVISSDYSGKKYVNTFTKSGKFISRTSL